MAEQNIELENVAKADDDDDDDDDRQEADLQLMAGQE